MYGSCGVRYFRTDDDFSNDIESATFDGTNYDKTMPTGVFDLCYDINIDNNLIGPQLGWTTDYCICCRWNIFMNSTMGIFGNHIDQSQRLWSPGRRRPLPANPGCRSTSTTTAMTSPSSANCVRVARTTSTAIGGLCAPTVL